MNPAIGSITKSMKNAVMVNVTIVYSEVLKFEKPDLAILTGDIVFGYCFIVNCSFFEIRDCIRPTSKK